MNPLFKVIIYVFVTSICVTIPFARKGYSETMPDYKNLNLSVEKRVADLLGRMTSKKKSPRPGASGRRTKK